MTGPTLVSAGTLALAGVLAACDTASGICPAVIEPALVVRVVDAASGAPLADGVVAVARDGAYADTLGPHGHDDTGELVALAGAWGRTGTYAVVVERGGDESWVREGVTVPLSEGECPQPVTATLEARLDRTP